MDPLHKHFPYILLGSKTLRTKCIRIDQWVPVISTGKVSDGCIRDLEFNPHLHQKLARGK